MKKYRLLSTLLTTLLLAAVLCPFSVFALEEPEITARHALLMDAKYDEVLYEKSGYEKAYPASITKVMTALLVAEAIDRGELSQDDVVVASTTALSNLHANGSTANIKAGEELTVKNLLYCLLLPSANEAANILAEAVSGDVASFVALMNQRAQELGCTGTHFANTHGLHDEEHYTTAYDICLFMKQAVSHDLLLEIMGSEMCSIPETNLSKARTYYNTNGLVSNWHYLGYTYDKAIAGKTGTTDEAGRCLVSAAVDAEQDEFLISVILDAPPREKENGKTDLRHFTESKELLKWGFANFQRTTISKGETPVAQVAVTLSQEADSVMLKPVGEFSRTLPVDMNMEEIKSVIALFQETIEAPVEEGQVLGTMTLSYGDMVFGALDLVAVNSVERSDFLYRQAQVEAFFRQSGTQLILAVVIILALLILLKLFVFRKRRRPSASGHRGRYSGKRRY